MNPQNLHDAWLVITVIATVAISGMAIFLWRTFRNSSRKWFFWTMAMVFAMIALEHVTAEIKNLNIPPPTDAFVAWQWLAGRTAEAVAASLGLGYMLFGQNGKSKHDPNGGAIHNG